MMATHFSHSRTLFLTESGSPLRFYLRPSAAKRQLYPLILHGGGVMCKTQEPGAILLWDSGELLPLESAKKAKATGSVYISTRYITDCVERNEILDLSAYRLLEETRVVGNMPGTCCVQKLPCFQQSGRISFCQAEDLAILAYLRDHAAPGSACSGNAIWKEMQQLQLTRHSWQAMRDRYLKHLQHRKDLYQLQARPHTPHSSQCSRHPMNNREKQTEACPLQPSTQTLSSRKGVTAVQNTTSTHIPSPQLPQESFLTEELSDRVMAKFYEMQAAKMLEGNNLNSDKSLKVQRKASETKPPAEEGILRIFEIANREFEVDDDIFEAAETLSPGKDKEQKESLEPQVVKETVGLKNVMSEDSAVPDPQPPAEVPIGQSDTEVEEVKRCIQGLMEEFGFSLAVITQAFLKNSGELEATRYFLKNRKRADGYPIWTFLDDMLLEEKDPKIKRKLIKKYGSKNVAKRYTFLNS